MALDPFKAPRDAGLIQRQRTESEEPSPLRRPIVIPVTTVTTSNVTLHTVTDERFMLLRELGVCNLTAAEILITVHLVPDGGSAEAGNKVYNDYSVAANESVQLTALTGSTLQPGDKIIVVTDDATGANFWMDGMEFEGGVADV